MQVADLQDHLDRHDRVLSRGVSLLESSPHPWIERHRVQPPPQAIDQVVSVNERIAAWLTQRLGSMWIFYAAGLTQVLWIGLAEVGVQRFDPYPFAFMTFLSTLAQLIFMVVIMVGQDVLGRAADRRSEQTFLDAGAILHECRRMKARLTAQDRVISSLSDYTITQVTEHLAPAIHDAYIHAVCAASLDAATGKGAVSGSGLSLRPWDELPEKLKESNRAQARQIGEKLAVIGCLMIPAFDPALTFAFADEEVQLLARLEHERWVAEQMARARLPGSGPQDPSHPDLVPWEELSDEARAKNVQAVRSIPDLLASVGFQVLRDSKAQDGAGQADFTADEWAILQQAMMTAGVLVSLAEGVDPDEILVLIKKLRQTSVSHPRRFIRELTAASAFDTGLRADTRYADYEPAALEAIRSATAIVAEKLPAELPGFRAFLVEIATVVADASKEGGFFGVGARRRTPSEVAAVQAVSRATGLEG
jgi:hypothetical protein